MKEHQEAKLAQRQRPPQGLPPVERSKRRKKHEIDHAPVNTLSSGSKYSPHRISPFQLHRKVQKPESKVYFLVRNYKSCVAKRGTNLWTIKSEPETKPKIARRAPQAKPKARNGRTYTMLEQEEQNLRQQLMERDMRLQESERRQEVSFSSKV